MLKNKSDYELLVELALQFIQVVNTLPTQHYPIIYIQTDKKREGFCLVSVTANEFIFKVLDDVESYESYCRFIQRLAKKQDQRLIQKESLRQSQLLLKISKTVQFYAHERTVHLNDEYACALQQQVVGHDLMPLQNDENFLFLTECLQRWLNGFSQFKSQKTRLDVDAVYEFSEDLQLQKKIIRFKPKESLTYQNEILFYRLLKLPLKPEVWEGVQFFLTTDFIRCVYMCGFDMQTQFVSKQSGEQMFLDVGEYDSPKRLIEHFLNVLQSVGFRPEKIVFDDALMLQIFEKSCKKLKIMVEVGPIETTERLWSLENIRHAPVFKLSDFYEETKRYSSFVLSQCADEFSVEQRDDFVNHLAMFRYQMFIHTAKFEERWTPVEFEMVLSLLVEHFDEKRFRDIFIRNILVYVTYLKSYTFIPYAEKFLALLNEQLKNESDTSVVMFFGRPN